MVKASIIMPVFNAVNYIDNAIESIINQSYKNFELIIVDDGATDGTGEKCQDYAREYPNIIYIRQKNAGTCAARNKGIAIAKGEYIAFADHDDVYLEDYLLELIGLADRDSLDIVKCGVFYKETYADGQCRSKKEVFRKTTLTREELVKRYNALPISYFGVWNTLYRTDILKKYNVRFPESIRHGQEDYFFNTEIIPYINKVGFSDRVLYRHYRRLAQSTSAKYYEDRIDAMVLYCQKEQHVLEPLISAKNWPLEYSILYSRKLAGILSYCLNTDAESPEEKCEQALDRFISACPYKEKLRIVLFVKVLGKSIKYGLVLLLAMSRQYHMMIQIWKNRNKRNS